MFGVGDQAVEAVQAIGRPFPVLEIVAGLVGLILVIFVHGIGIRSINRRFASVWVRVTGRTPHWQVDIYLVLAVGALALLHLAETLIWAVPISSLGIIPDMRDSYYYVLESYTTLGEGNVQLPSDWRLIGPIIAMSGVFTFGWTGSVLVSIMTDFAKYDRSRATARGRRGAGDEDQP